MKLPFAFSTSGGLFCLIWPIVYMSELVPGTSQSSDLGSIALSGLVIVGFPLPIGLAIFGLSYHKLFEWKTATETERKSFLQSEQMSLSKRWASTIGVMLLISSLMALLLYGFYLIAGFATIWISLPMFLGATLVSTSYAAIVALCWLAMCDRKLRATRTATS